MTKKKSWLKKKGEGGRVGKMAQGVGPEFKPQYCKNKKKKERRKISPNISGNCEQINQTWWQA
jgi:hypothetical protein